MKYLKGLLLVASSVITSTAFAEPQEIHLWRHQANEAEVLSSLTAIQRFNASQDDWKIMPDIIPEHSYTQAVMAAAQADVLPCIIDIDQPLVPNFAWHGYLTPLDDLLERDHIDSFISSAKGTYKGKIYSIGQFDVALALFTRASLLRKLDVRYPTIEQPWTKPEFMDVLNQIKALRQYEYPFDMRAFDKTEWIPYAWSSFMISWGADLIDRANYMKADGVLNSKAAIEFGQWIQMLFEQGYMNADAKADADLADNKVAIQFNGSWFLKKYEEALGDDLAILPVPDFGHGAVIGGGSWHWAISSSCTSPEGAGAFLAFMTTPEEIHRQGETRSGFPATTDAATLDPNYSENGKWRSVYEFSKKFAKLRPETPIYSVISSAYRKAMEDIIVGLEPKTALDMAVEKIDAAARRYQEERY